MDETPGPVHAFRRRTRRALDFGTGLARCGVPSRRDKNVTFVVGCQRSGTSMLLAMIASDPYALAYPEGTNLAFRDHRLRPTTTLEHVLRWSPARSVVLKPLCDSQWTDRLLDDHPGSRALWVHRNPFDVARSAVRRWGDHQLDVIRRIRRGDLGDLDWRGERLPQSTLAALRDTRPTTPLEGALLFWYLRNTFLFELHLDREERVRIVDYDRLVDDPTRHFPDIAAFAAAHPPASAARRITKQQEIRDEERPSAVIVDLVESIRDRFRRASAECRS